MLPERKVEQGTHWSRRDVKDTSPTQTAGSKREGDRWRVRQRAIDSFSSKNQQLEGRKRERGGEGRSLLARAGSRETTLKCMGGLDG